MNELERVLTAGEDDANRTRREAIAVQREALEVSKSEMRLHKRTFELERQRTAATIATERVKAGDTSVTWNEAFEEARDMLGGTSDVREPQETVSDWSDSLL